MSEATQEFACRVAHFHFHSRKHSYLHREAALRELLRDRAMNYGSSHGEVTLAPNERGLVSVPSGLEIGGSFELRYLGSRLAWSSGQYSRFVRDFRCRGLVVFGRWCVEETGIFFVQQKKNKLEPDRA